MQCRPYPHKPIRANKVPLSFNFWKQKNSGPRLYQGELGVLPPATKRRLVLEGSNGEGRFTPGKVGWSGILCCGGIEGGGRTLAITKGKSEDCGLHEQNAFAGQGQLWYRGILWEPTPYPSIRFLNMWRSSISKTSSTSRISSTAGFSIKKRNAIVSRAKQAKANVRKNISRRGMVKDLLADLNS